MRVIRRRTLPNQDIEHDMRADSKCRFTRDRQWTTPQQEEEAEARRSYGEDKSDRARLARKKSANKNEAVTMKSLSEKATMWTARCLDTLPARHDTRRTTAR